MNAILPPITEVQTAALELLREGRRFLLVGHIHPDGDCLGSQVALAHLLREAGKEVVILNPDHPGSLYDFLRSTFPFGPYSGEALPPHDVCILLDINELSRCGDLEGPIREAPSKKMVVDHHPTVGEAWWDGAFSDVEASATGVLVWRIAQHLGYSLNLGVSEALFTALVTDTGWFKYSNTDAETIGVAADLVARGVRPDRVFARLHQNNALDHPRSMGNILGRAEYFADHRIVVVDHPLPAHGGPSLEDSDPVLDILRSVGGVEVVIYLRELEGGCCKLSARSKQDFDVNVLARRFGGGGHTKASGATIRGSLAEVKARLIEATIELLGEHPTAERGGGG
jgi:bifunctional oligoribonuclease and PAP phosphatase NrnA